MSLQYFIVNAFTDSPFGGNPAAVVFVENSLDPDIMQKISTNFNQPMTAFLRLRTNSISESAGTSLVYDVRWFTSTAEAPICGHATLASAGLLFAEPDLLPETVTSISFCGRSGVNLVARKEGEWISMSLSSTAVIPLPEDLADRAKAVIRKAVEEDVPVKFVGMGGTGFAQYLLAEIDPSVDLAALQVNPNELVSPERSELVIQSLIRPL